MPRQSFLQEFQCGILVARLRHEAPEHVTFLVDSASEVVVISVDLHKDLVQVPAPVARAQARKPTLSDLRRKHRSEPVPPEPGGPIADVDPSHVQQVLAIAQRQREPDVHDHGKTDDLMARLEVSKREVLGPLSRVGRPHRQINKVPLTAPIGSVSPREGILRPSGDLRNKARSDTLMSRRAPSRPIAPSHMATSSRCTASGKTSALTAHCGGRCALTGGILMSRPSCGPWSSTGS
jgi:hypothetical protein